MENFRQQWRANFHQGRGRLTKVGLPRGRPVTDELAATLKSAQRPATKRQANENEDLQGKMFPSYA